MDFQANHCPIPAITVRREMNFRCPYPITFEADYRSTTSVTEYEYLVASILPHPLVVQSAPKRVQRTPTTMATRCRLSRAR